MPCIVALIVFGILGIFSASHRALAREAFDCVFRRITFRPCNTGFQEKIKGKILSRLINRSTWLTKVVNKNYELLAWIFFILMVGSTFWILRGGYNFYVYGSCNGLNESGFCAFDPSGENNKISTSENGLACGITQINESNLTLNNVDLSYFPSKNMEYKNNFVFVGCYACDYSRKVYPEITKLLEDKKVNYTFAHYPVKGHTEFLSNIGYCVYENYEEKFWEFNDYLFTADKDYVINKSNTNEILNKFDFDVDIINQCVGSEKTNLIVAKQIEELNKTNIYGTPTIFINNKPFVGPKPLRVYKSAINKFIFF